jgi:hypothetical protein
MELADPALPTSTGSPDRSLNVGSADPQQASV